MIFLFIWALVLWTILKKNFAQKPMLDKSWKRKHVVFIFLLVLSHAYSFRTLGWATGHWNSVPDLYRVRVGIFSPDFRLALWFASLIVGMWSVSLGLGLANRRAWAQNFVLKSIPLIWLVDSLNMSVGVNTNKPGIMSVIVPMAIVAVPYVLMFRFYLKNKYEPVHAHGIGVGS